MTERVATLETNDTAVKKSILVETDRAHAFEVFTSGVDRWWDRSHHIGTAPLDKMVIEPRRGGRCYGVDADGEWDWGRVLVWEPPSRVVIAWQLTAEWQYDAAFETEVEVRFTSEAENRTRVELEHRNLERYGDAQAAIRESLGSDGGWTGSLEAYAKAAEA
jgi:uncharacterized protein YndB with AHSA1/START domain